MPKRRKKIPDFFLPIYIKKEMTEEQEKKLMQCVSILELTSIFLKTLIEKQQKQNESLSETLHPNIGSEGLTKESEK